MHHCKERCRVQRGISRSATVQIVIMMREEYTEPAEADTLVLASPGRRALGNSDNALRLRKVTRIRRPPPDGRHPHTHILAEGVEAKR